MSDATPSHHLNDQSCFSQDPRDAITVGGPASIDFRQSAGVHAPRQLLGQGVGHAGNGLQELGDHLVKGMALAIEQEDLAPLAAPRGPIFYLLGVRPSPESASAREAIRLETRRAKKPSAATFPLGLASGTADRT